MQVELNITLELPDEFAGLTPEELRQVLYDEYVSAIAGHHAAEAVEWCARGRVGSGNEDPAARLVYENHSRWHKITSRPNWTLMVKPKA
jgi:hypothetical protein